MREAYDMGYNCVSLIDCVSTVTMAGYEACTKITYPFVSTPMKSQNFVRNLKEASGGGKGRPLTEGVQAPAPKRQRQETSDQVSQQPFTDDLPAWDVRRIDEGGTVFQLGPWRVDVRQKVEGEVKCQTDGRKELERYIYMAQCFGNDTDASRSVYAEKLNTILSQDSCKCGPSDDNEAFGWGCCMTVIRLPLGAGCLLYSPVLDDDHRLDKVRNFLEAEKLLPVKYIFCPTPQHHLCLREYRDAFPSAFMICTETRGGVMPPLHKRRRDLDFDCILHPEVVAGKELIEWKAPTVQCSVEWKARTSPSNRKLEADAPSIDQHKQYLTEFLDIFIVEDNRTTEIDLIHKPSGVLVLSDLLYKSSNRAELKGPGGASHRYSFPKWFAQGQEELFYKLQSDNSNGLLPAYRTHPSYRKIDLAGCGKAITKILEAVSSRDVQKCVTCHTDPMDGQKLIIETITSAWSFLL